MDFDMSPEDLKADIKWIDEIVGLEDLVEMLPLGSKERLEASINLAELNGDL